MSFKKVIILIFLLVAVFFVALHFSKKPVLAPVELVPQEKSAVQEVTYTNPANNQKLKVVYYPDNTAVIYPGDVNEVIFTSTTTAATTTSDSEVRYENIKKGLILLNKENDINLYLNDSLIFEGATE
jgi:hypothetical protein